MTPHGGADRRGDTPAFVDSLDVEEDMERRCQELILRASER